MAGPQKAASSIPTDPTQIFSWLICQSYDDKGNAIVYEYKEEDSDGHRSGAGSTNVIAQHRQVASANRYLKRIRYGNRTPILPDS